MKQLTIGLLSGLLLTACATEANQRFSIRTEADEFNFGAPPSLEVAERDAALVRFVHAAPDTNQVDVYAGDMVLRENVGFGDLTPFLEIQAEEWTFGLRPSGDHRAEFLGEASGELAAGRHYTVLAVREQSRARADIVIVEDALTDPTPGRAKVRVINAIQDVDEIDVYTPGSEEPIIGSIAFKDTSDYVELTPMSAILRVHREGEETLLFDTPLENFEAGTVSTVIIYGRSIDGPGVRSLIIRDTFVGN